jgi:integrase
MKPSQADSTLILVRGWPLVERRLDAAQESFDNARASEQFAAVGDACAEVLLLVVQAVYVQDRDQFGNRATLRLDTTLRDLLDAFIAQKLSGHSADVARASLAGAASYIDAGTNDAQSAELCLTATGTIVRYLSISAGRRKSRDTIAELCKRLIDETPDIGVSHRYVLQRLASMPIGRRVASELQPDDIIEHIRRRRQEVVAATATQDITFLKGVLLMARDSWNLDVSPDLLDRAKRELLKAGLIGRSTPRSRRPTREELQSLVAYFEEYEKRKRAKIPMRDIMEFALWSARRIGEICDLRWEDLNEKQRTCIVRVTDARGRVRRHEFPLLGKAFDIVMRQPRTSDHIFPYNSKSAGAAYTLAKNALNIKNLTFQDLRREAAIRLYEAGHSVEQIAKVTGRIEANTLLRDIGARPSSRAAIEQAEPALATEKGEMERV